MLRLKRLTRSKGDGEKGRKEGLRPHVRSDLIKLMKERERERGSSSQGETRVRNALHSEKGVQFQQEFLSTDSCLCMRKREGLKRKPFWPLLYLV